MAEAYRQRYEDYLRMSDEGNKHEAIPNSLPPMLMQKRGGEALTA